MAMSITVLLSYSVYLSIIADSLPRTSEQVCILQVYLTSLLGLTAAAVLLSVLVIRLHHRSDNPVGEKTKLAVSVIRILLHFNEKSQCKNAVRPCHEEVNSVQAAVTDIASAAHVVGAGTSTPHTSNADHKLMKPVHACDDGDVTWPYVAETLDRVFFCAFSFVIVIGTCTVFPYIALAGDFDPPGPRAPGEHGCHKLEMFND